MGGGKSDSKAANNASKLVAQRGVMMVCIYYFCWGMVCILAFIDITGGSYGPQADIAAVMLIKTAPLLDSAIVGFTLYNVIQRQKRVERRKSEMEVCACACALVLARVCVRLRVRVRRDLVRETAVCVRSSHHAHTCTYTDTHTHPHACPQSSQGGSTKRGSAAGSTADGGSVHSVNCSHCKSPVSLFGSAPFWPVAAVFIYMPVDTNTPPISRPFPPLSLSVGVPCELPCRHDFRPCRFSRRPSHQRWLDRDQRLVNVRFM